MFTKTFSLTLLIFHFNFWNTNGHEIIDGEVGKQKICFNIINCNFDTTFTAFTDQSINSDIIEIKSNYKNVENVDGFIIASNYTVDYLPINIDEYFPNLTSYQVRDVAIKKISKVNFRNLKSLRLLNIAGLNENEMEIESNVFDDLINLENLILTKSKIKQLDENLFNNNQKLNYLGLQKNELTNLSPKLFTNLNNLKVLLLNENKIQSLDENIFENSLNLEFLTFNGNGLKSLPENIFKNQVNLQSIFFSVNELTTLHENLFAHNLKLRFISLDSNKISSLSWKTFENLHNLHRINLSLNVCIDLSSFELEKYPERRKILQNLIEENC